MVAVMTAVEVIRCKACGKPIARREGARLVIERKGSNPVYMEIEGGNVLLQCHYAPLDAFGRPNPCRENNRVCA